MQQSGLTESTPLHIMATTADTMHYIGLHSYYHRVNFKPSSWPLTKESSSRLRTEKLLMLTTLTIIPTMVAIDKVYIVLVSTLAIDATRTRTVRTKSGPAASRCPKHQYSCFLW